MAESAALKHRPGEDTFAVRVLHDYYDPEHLDDVREEMRRLGTPVIRACWDASTGVWQALEGNHRLRAAQELGLVPVIVEVAPDVVLGEDYDCARCRGKTAAAIVEETRGNELLTFRVRSVG